MNFIPLPLTNNYQQADTGTKMIHIGKNTRSTIVVERYFRRDTGIIRIAGKSRFRKVPAAPAILRNAIHCCIGDTVRSAYVSLYRSQEFNVTDRT